ncbi:MAG: hypothetical protein RLZ86_1028 [Actinomycetota bacterium]
MKRKYSTRRRLLAVAVGASLVVASCGGDDGESSSSDEPATSAPQATEAPSEETMAPAEPEAAEGCESTVAGSELNIGVYVPTGSLDPLRTSGALVGGTDIAAIYDVLMRWDEASGEWVPHLAESLESNSDYTEWTLTLREGVTYANGDPMLAEHVLANMNRLLGPGANASRGLIARVDLENSTVVDDRTVTFKLFSPWVEFAYLLGDAAGMVVNPSLGDAKDASDVSLISTDPNGAGAGPYLVDKFAPGESPYLVLKARDDYWGGPVCIETVNMVYITSDQPKLEALDLGELDLAFLRTANVIADARSSGQYSEAFFLQSAGEVILINNGVGTHTPVTADKRFRQAVNLAIDSSVISERAFGGELLESKAFIDERSTYYSGVAGTSADPDAARALVDELKAEGWDGSIRFNCRDTNANLPVAIVASLEAVGMTVEATITDQNSSIGAVIQKDFDMACWGWNISDSALYRQIGFNFRSDSPSNRIGYGNPDMDAAIDEMFAAPDREARTNAIAKMSEIFNEDVPSVIYAAVEEGYAISDRVAGIVPTQQTVLLLGDAYLVS